MCNFSGRMYAMKCLYKKRIKMKQGERMAVNERDILARVDTPFIVCLNYAFQTTDRLCFILDLMNGLKNESYDWSNFTLKVP